MNPKRSFLALLLAVVLIGCSKPPEPRHIVILVDVSGSIERDALAQAFKAIDELVSHLQRGDRITVIPILGDAQAEASGRILRFEVPVNRQAYDSDLRHFRVLLKNTLDNTQAEAVAHPGSKTDILGSIALAEQEFHTASEHPAQQLVILSDFIQESDEVNFKTNKCLANATVAKDFATRLMNNHGTDLKGIPVYLGALKSNEYSNLLRSRRYAIQAFWIEYFEASHAHPRFVVDGPGLLSGSVAASIDGAPEFQSP